MAVDGNQLQGELNSDPATDEKEVERLLKGFLQALLIEDRQSRPTQSNEDRASIQEPASPAHNILDHMSRSTGTLS